MLCFSESGSIYVAMRFFYSENSQKRQVFANLYKCEKIEKNY